MENKVVKYEGREITIEPTHDRISMDGINPNNTPPSLAAQFAKNCQEAIDLLGYHDMQTIRVSCTPMGMGTAMKGGDYIDIYHSVGVFKAIKAELLIRKAQWEEIAAGQE